MAAGQPSCPTRDTGSSSVLHSTSHSGPLRKVGTLFPFYVVKPRLRETSIFETTQLEQVFDARHCSLVGTSLLMLQGGRGQD